MNNEKQLEIGEKYMVREYVIPLSEQISALKAIVYETGQLLMVAQYTDELGDKNEIAAYYVRKYKKLLELQNDRFYR